MPKDTFFNLPEDKRAAICDVAIDEFAAYAYERASVNRIVAKAGIAKGSFYQYFEDKRDLFLYIAHLIAEKKITYISPVMRNPEEVDFFTLIRELFLSGIQFARAHPRYAAIGNRLLGNPESAIYREVKAENLPSSFAIYERLLENAVAQGDVRADIDVHMLAHVIGSMSVTVVEYFSEFYFQAMEDAMMDAVDQFMDFLKNGLGTLPVECG